MSRVTLYAAGAPLFLTSNQGIHRFAFARDYVNEILLIRIGAANQQYAICPQGSFNKNTHGVLSENLHEEIHRYICYQIGESSM